MPSTINGVGTGYWGSGNRKTRTGVCRSCGKTAVLSSYDTWLCFVVLFLPIIPLRKLRIIDDCSICRRHWAAKRDQYEMDRQLNLSGAQQRYREEPSPEVALEVHAVLLGFHEYEQAKEFRPEAANRFPNSSDLAVGLGMQLESVGQYDEARPWYDKALELNPELPQARTAVARHKMGEGDLDGARALLDHLEQPGAAQTYPLGVLETLAQFYQRQGRHEETLDLCRHLLSEVPEAAEHYKFRKFVRTSERALRRQVSILPPRQHALVSLLNFKSPSYAPWLRFTVVAGLIAMLVLVGMGVNNEHIRANRKLHLFNGFTTPARVSIDDQPPIEVTNRAELLLREGRHHVHIAGPLEEDYDFDMTANYFDRWLKSPAWIINVGGAANLAMTDVVYGAAPPPSVSVPLVGQRFITRPNVDYLFTPAPRTMKVENRNQLIRKTAIELQSGAPQEMVAVLGKQLPESAMLYAEEQLPIHPEEQPLFEAYVELAEAHGWQTRASDFLRAGCSRRPVQIYWHRAYQTYLEKLGEQDKLLAEYEEALRDDPQNGSLLYLRGRVDPDPESGLKYFKQAIAADDSLAWPWYAIAYQQESMGHWRECLDSVEQARKRHMDEQQLMAVSHVPDLVLGDHKQLAERYRERIKAAPDDAAALLCLIDVLAIDGDPIGAQLALEAWTSQVPNNAPDRDRLLAPLRQIVLYQLGEMPALAESLARFGDSSSAMKAASWMITGKSREAADDPSLAAVWKSARAALALSIALGLDGHNEAAAEWRGLAADQLAKEGLDSQRLAKLLRATSAPSVSEVLNTVMLIGDKAMLFAALAQQFPDSREMYLAEVPRFNVTRLPPYQLLAKAAPAKLAEKALPAEPPQRAEQATRAGNRASPAARIRARLNRRGD